MNKMYLDRLSKLADHIYLGQLDHEVFDFEHFNATAHGTAFRSDGCGTNGCAIGECPAVFSEWHFAGRNNLPLLRGKSMDTQEAAMWFFELDYDEFTHLFMPSNDYKEKQHPDKYGGKRLDINATHHQVANQMFEFIKIKEKPIEEKVVS